MKTHQYNEADTTTTTSVCVGDTIEVCLSENASCGYAWAIADGAEVELLKQGNGDFKLDSENPEIVGGGGVVTWRWTAVSPGEAKIALDYKRSWENIPPTSTFRLTVNIQAGEG